MPKSPRGSRELPDALSQGHSVAETKLRHTLDRATLGHDQDAKWPRKRDREREHSRGAVRRGAGGASA